MSRLALYLVCKNPLLYHVMHTEFSFMLLFSTFRFCLCFWGRVVVAEPCMLIQAMPAQISQSCVQSINYSVYVCVCACMCRLMFSTYTWSTCLVPDSFPCADYFSFLTLKSPTLLHCRYRFCLFDWSTSFKCMCTCVCAHATHLEVVFWCSSDWLADVDLMLFFFLMFVSLFIDHPMFCLL